MAYRVVERKPTTPLGKKRYAMYEEKVISLTASAQIDEAATINVSAAA